MQKFSLVLLIHAHQPVGNFDDVMERTYERSYLPFLDCLARHPRVRVGLHYSGPLLEWIAERHPEYLQRIGELAARDQIEVVGGGFYEPILITIPPEDQIEQIRLLSEFIAKHFGKRPGGAWLAERVWEPQLPAALAEAGVDYTLLDDSHFLAAGREMPELYGYYIAEDRGRTVKVIPGLQELRYLLPFGSVDDSMRVSARRGRASIRAEWRPWATTWKNLAAGPTPTSTVTVTAGWTISLRRWRPIRTGWKSFRRAKPSATRMPLGRVDLPTASYTEMMEWVLPTPVRQKFHALQEEFAGRPGRPAISARRILARIFQQVRGIQPAAQENAARFLETAPTERRKEPKKAPRSRRRAKALTHLLRAQCNDAYWHGIFGGLYAPHLRTALWRELVRAETIAGRAAALAESGIR